MRFNPIKFLEGLLCTAPALLLTLAACGGGGGGGSTPIAPVVAPSFAPAGASAVAACHTINLSWNAVAGATGYNVYGAASGVQVITPSNKLTATPVTSTSYDDAGLASGTTRYYQITAVNSAGEGPGSSVVMGSTAMSCPIIGGSIQGNALTLSTAVSTMEGTAGNLGYANGTGSVVQFSSPANVTTDGTNLYVADTNNNVIRKIVISTRAVTTLAGTAGLSGSADSNTPPVTFNGPQGITTDGTYIYVADTGNGSIRKIDSSGNVTTITSSGTFLLPAAITYDGTANLYVTDTGRGAIRMVPTATGLEDPTFNASVASPQGITYTGSTLYVTSYATGVSNIYSVTTSGAGVPTVLTGTSGLNAPQGITTDGTNLYIANSGDHTIRTIPVAGGTLSLVAGATGISGSTDASLGINARFNHPGGITTDGTNLYITDTGNQTIRKIQ